MGKGQNTLSSPVVGSTERGRSPQEETLCRARAGCLGQEPSAGEVLQLCREGDTSGLSEQLSEMSIYAITQGFGKKKKKVIIQVWASQGCHKNGHMLHRDRRAVTPSRSPRCHRVMPAMGW